MRKQRSFIDGVVDGQNERFLTLNRSRLTSNFRVDLRIVPAIVSNKGELILGEAEIGGTPPRAE